MWYHVDLVITPTVPRPSGSNRADRLALACVSGRGHPHRHQPHQDLPGAQGEFNVKKGEGWYMEAFSRPSSTSSTTRGSSSWSWAVFSSQPQSIFSLFSESLIWSKQVLTFNVHSTCKCRIAKYISLISRECTILGNADGFPGVEIKFPCGCLLSHCCCHPNVPFYHWVWYLCSGFSSFTAKFSA